MTYICPFIFTFMAYGPPYFSVNGMMIVVLAYKNGFKSKSVYYIKEYICQDIFQINCLYFLSFGRNWSVFRNQDFTPKFSVVQKCIFWKLGAK